MSGAMNRHCIPGLTIFTSPDEELLCGVSGNSKTIHQGLNAAHVLHYADAPVLTRKKPDVMI